MINVYLGIDTHTNPCPPPGAGVAVPVLRVTGSAEGDALTELLGLKKSPSLNLGDAVGLAAVASVIACLRGYVAFGDPAGNSADAGEAAVSAGQAVASFFSCWRCSFAGEGDSVGNSTILSLHNASADKTDY